MSVTQSNTVILGSGADVGIRTTTPTAALDVNGSTRLRGLTGTGTRAVVAAADGTLAPAAPTSMLARLASAQSGTAVIGGGIAGVNTYTITFPVAFAAAPGQVLVTVRTAAGQTYTDTFSATTREITATSFKVNVYRVESAGAAWGQNLQVDWMAIP